ncbi:F-box/FBD/LRR-repeat protein At1g13570-like [Lycium barbarum]|uniref:F-box/FBD/LRR-repeat protein At1g13570-like n=1 Tax=Lycium barbarum TaxID=112863 RepID=UPI00293F1AC2|nr:F-box/FBD/LRR-repeat protein At1g13570-like [Lycium barbarum]
MARLRRNDSHIGQNYVNQYDEGHDIDKISKLPRNLIDDILKRMTIKEVARMSVLSQKWNQIWSTHPFLVLDRRFHEEIDYQNRSSSSVTFDFKNIINKILLQHSGSIVKFVLDISTVGSDWDLHHWLRYVSNNGLKELKIENNSIQSTYTLPSFVFNSGELSRLDITNCDFKMPLTSTSFQNLVRLDLRLISFDPILVYTKLVAPLLSIMVLTYCDGLQYLNISAPRLRGLHIVDSHYVDLIVLKAYPNLKTLTIVTCDKIEQYEFWRRFTLTDIICSFPKLIGLDFNSPFFKVETIFHL